MFNKILKKLLVSIGALIFILFLSLNIQIGMNDGSTRDLNLMGVEASIYSPIAIATVSDGWAEVCCGAACTGGDRCLADGNYICCKE